MQVLIETYKKNGQLGNAYLFEGAHEEVFPELLTTLGTLGFQVEKNPDIWSGVFENLGIDDARNITGISVGRPFAGNDRFFLISTNTFTLEAQNALLKTFEDAKEGAHFFLVVPKRNILLPTLASRFVFVARDEEEHKGGELAKNFFSLSKAKRLKVIEPIVKEKDKSAALVFLDALEGESRKARVSEKEWYTRLFEAKRYLNTRGASVKLILEGLALAAPAGNISK